jgi:hypothetical protein
MDLFSDADVVVIILVWVTCIALSSISLLALLYKRHHLALRTAGVASFLGVPFVYFLDVGVDVLRDPDMLLMMVLITAPLVLGVVSISASALGLWRLRNTPTGPHICKQCGYDTRYNEVRCSECGMPKEL